MALWSYDIPCEKLSEIDFKYIDSIFLWAYHTKCTFGSQTLFWKYVKIAVQETVAPALCWFSFHWWPVSIMSWWLLLWWHSWFDLSAVFVYNLLNTLMKVKDKGICCCSFFPGEEQGGNRDFKGQQLKTWHADLVVSMGTFIPLWLFLQVALPSSVFWGLSHCASHPFPGHWDIWRADSELGFLLNWIFYNTSSLPLGSEIRRHRAESSSFFLKILFRLLNYVVGQHTKWEGNKKYFSPFPNLSQQLSLLRVSVLFSRAKGISKGV